MTLAKIKPHIIVSERSCKAHCPYLKRTGIAWQVSESITLARSLYPEIVDARPRLDLDHAFIKTVLMFTSTLLSEEQGDFEQ